MEQEGERMNWRNDPVTDKQRKYIGKRILILASVINMVDEAPTIIEAEER